MSRNGDQARQRLQQAAVDLYLEHGFDRTTAADIAARAGVTERTFFRHFSDKRDVLFDGEEALGGALTRAVAQAPGILNPLQTLLFAFHGVVGMLEESRSFSEPRQAVIAATPALRERELSKAESLSRDLAAALSRRGVPERVATLAGQVGMIAFGQAFNSWIEDPSPGLRLLLDRAFVDVHGLSSPLPAPSD
jgi:AcrR family transcriptional regulator